VNVVGKISLLAVSLVAACPAAYLSYEMVMTFLNRSEGLETIMLVLAGVTLTGSTVIALSPVGILLFTPSAGDVQQQAQTGADAGDDELAADDDALEADDDFGDMGDDDLEEEDDNDNFEFEDDDDWE